MIAVVLAAGRGTRLQAVTGGRPKAVLEVAGRPAIVWGLAALAELRPARFVLVVGRGREQVEAAVGARFSGVPVAYVEQPAPTGMADALLCARAHVVGDLPSAAGVPARADDPVAVMNGDNVYAADLRPALRQHQAGSPDATLLVERLPPELAVQGVCRIEDTGRVVEIWDRPSPVQRETGVVSAGFYLFRPSAIFDACRRVVPSAGGERELSAAINLMIREGRSVRASWLDGRRVNLNQPEDLERAANLLAAGAPTERPRP